MEKKKTKKTTAPWTNADIKVLRQAIENFPQDADGRIDAIVSYVNSETGCVRDEKDIAKKIEELANKKQATTPTSKAKVTSPTQKVAAKQNVKSPSSSSNNEENDEKKSQEATNNNKKNKKKGKQTSDEEDWETVSSTELNGNNNANTSPTSKKDAEKEKPKPKPKINWTQTEQQAFEAALAAHPVNKYPEDRRWTLIGEAVGKSADQCRERFQHIRAQLQAQKSLYDV